MWPAHIALSPRFIGNDERRIVSVDVHCTGEDIDDSWLHKCLIAVPSSEAVGGLEWLCCSLWHAAQQQQQDTASYSSTRIDSVELLEQKLSILANAAVGGGCVFLKRNCSFRRYTVVPIDENSAPVEQLDAAAIAAPVQKRSVSQQSNTQMSPTSRVVLIEEKKQQRNESGSSFNNSSYNTNLFGRSSESNVTTMINNMNGNKDQQNNNDDDDEEHQPTVAAALSPEFPQQQREASEGKQQQIEQDDQEEEFDHNCPRRAKVFSQAVAFEFVADVIGAVLVQRSATPVPL